MLPCSQGWHRNGGEALSHHFKPVKRFEIYSVPNSTLNLARYLHFGCSYVPQLILPLQVILWNLPIGVG